MQLSMVQKKSFSGCFCLRGEKTGRGWVGYHTGDGLSDKVCSRRGQDDIEIFQVLGDYAGEWQDGECIRDREEREKEAEGEDETL